MRYDILKEQYVPISIKPTIATNLKKQLNRKISTCSSTSSNFNGQESVLSSDLIDDLTLNDDDLNELKEKHRLLKQKMNEQEKRQIMHKNLLETNAQRRIELEIRPKFIVPDTNCFIDHLNLIDKLLSTNYYIIVVPLLVINELDKLAKSISNYNDDSIEHAE
jgi:protein SMG6